MRFQSAYSRNVVKVMTGTTLAQALPIAVAPILTRLYPPEAFGVFYLYAALVSILSVVATGRYELAILIPKEEREAFHTGLAAGWSTTLFSCLLLMLVVPFRHPLANFLGEPALAPWLFLLPASVFIQGWYNVGNFWHNRHKRFGLLTASKVLVSGANAGGRIGLAWLIHGAGGLIWGTFLSWVTGLLQFAVAFWKKDRQFFQSRQHSETRKQAHRFRHFPGTMVIGSLFNKGNIELPPILLNLFFTPAVAGFFGQMNAVLRQPLLVVGRAFEEVFKQQASEEIREMGHCKPVFRKTLFRLSLLGAGPFLILFWAAPAVFAFVFGPSWETAGIYARYFALPLFLQFVAAPLSALFYLKEYTRWYTILEFGQLALVLLALLLGATWLKNADQTLLLLAGAYTIGVGIRLILLWRIAHQ
ncbi:MAG: oligosaccharide flippase family protein [Saprospirales bacterium]|nr:oligosaccharide flippase family protein [Saprospirales bacterium]